MKGFLRGVLVIAFVLLTPVLLVLLALRFSGINSSYLKKEFSERKVYGEAVTEVFQHAQGPIRGFSAPFIQGVVEKVIDDTEKWVKNEGPEPKVTLLGVSPSVATQISQLADALERERESIRSQGVSVGEAEGGIDVAALLKDGLPLGENLRFVRTTYQVVTYGLPIILVVMALSVMVIILTLAENQSRLRWFGWMFLASSLVSVPGWLLVFFGSKAVFGILSGTDLPKISSAVADIFITPFADTYIRIASLAIGMLLVLALGSFIGSSRGKQPPFGRQK